MSGVPVVIESEKDHFGTSLTIDGQKIPELRRVIFDSGYPDECPRVQAEVNAFGEREVRLDARVELTVVALPGYVLEVEELNGKKIYRVHEE